VFSDRSSFLESVLCSGIVHVFDFLWMEELLLVLELGFSVDCKLVPERRLMIKSGLDLDMMVSWLGSWLFFICKFDLRL